MVMIGRKVLVVGDDPGILDVISMALESRGYQLKVWNAWTS
jgi:CheY-like chemotaxis protein